MCFSETESVSILKRSSIQTIAANWLASDFHYLINNDRSFALEKRIHAMIMPHA